MSLIAAISMWMLVTCVLTTSASLSDKTVPLGARQPPTLLGVRQHLQHYQETFLQTAVHLTSSAPLLAAASTVLSYQIIDNDTVFDLSIQPTTRTDTTQLADSLGGLDLARGIEDSEENPIEKQANLGNKAPRLSLHRSEWICNPQFHALLMLSSDRSRKLQMERLFLPQLGRSSQLSSSLHVRLRLRG
jgi:hypothetical protein